MLRLDGLYRLLADPAAIPRWAAARPSAL